MDRRPGDDWHQRLNDVRERNDREDDFAVRTRVAKEIEQARRTSDERYAAMRKADEDRMRAQALAEQQRRTAADRQRRADDDHAAMMKQRQARRP